MKTYKIRLNNTEYNKSQEEILQMNLSPDTLVWRKGFVNWMKLKDVPELNPVKNECSSKKISMSFRWMKAFDRKENQKEEIPFVVVDTEDKHGVISPNNITESPDGGIILGTSIQKRIRKKVFYIFTVIIIVAFACSIVFFFNQGFVVNQLDDYDTYSESMQVDTTCINTCDIDTGSTVAY